MMTVIPSVSTLLTLVERMPRPLLWTAAAHGALALVCLLAWRWEAAPILGVHPAVKPLKFAVSIAVFLATMGVLIPRLSTTAAVRGALAWALAVTMIVEVVPIVAQSLRGTTSHFNHASPLDRAVWAVMVLAIVAAMVPGIIEGTLGLRDTTSQFAMVSLGLIALALTTVGVAWAERRPTLHGLTFVLAADLAAVLGMMWLS
jgi:hypothetical protein